MNISLRDIKETDELLLKTLYLSQDEVVQTASFLPPKQQHKIADLQHFAQQQNYKNSYPNADYKIIVFEGIEIGRIYVNRTRNLIQLLDIIILNDYRNKGIGTYFLEKLCSESKKLKKKLSLHVRISNPAQRLYQRMGFEVIENTGTHLYMERPYEL